MDCGFLILTDPGDSAIKYFLDSVCVFSTERKSDRERLRKYTEVLTEGVKYWRIESIGHGRTRPVSLCVGSTERKSDRGEVFIEGAKCAQSYSIGHRPSFRVSN